LIGAVANHQGYALLQRSRIGWKALNPTNQIHDYQ